MVRKTTTPRTATRGASVENQALGCSDTTATDDKQTAHVMTNGQCNTLVVQQYLQYVNGGSNLQALSEVSRDHVQAIGGGDFSVLELMLMTQATALQAMFVDLATRARRQDRFDAIQTMTTLALKCAAQSRQAVTALAELRMPKTVTFAKQANVTNGPQQVNNVVVAKDSHARAEEIQTQGNKLLEAQHGGRMDTGAAGAAGGTDPHLATVGEVLRTEVTRG